MVERVARASFLFWKQQNSRVANFEDMNPDEMEFAMAHARAVIEAMRPTEAELKAAGCDDDNSGAPYCVDCSFLASEFGKLIDAALK